MKQINVLEYKKKSSKIQFNKYNIDVKENIIYNKEKILKKTDLKFKKCISIDNQLLLYEQYGRCTFSFWDLKRYNRKIKIYEYNETNYCLLINYSDIRTPYYEFMILNKDLLNEYIC